MRGRKPRPTAAKLLEGNPGHRPLNQAEPQPPPLDERSEAIPEELTDQPRAIAEWTRVVPMLRRCRQITEADRAALIALCLEWARYIEAGKKVEAAGMVVRAPSGYPMPNPYLGIASRALSGCNKLWVELGLTPSSRSRVRTDGPGPDGDAFTEFDAPLPVTPGPTSTH